MQYLTTRLVRRFRLYRLGALIMRGTPTGRQLVRFSYQYVPINGIGHWKLQLEWTPVESQIL